MDLNCALVHVPNLYLDNENNLKSEVNFSAMGLFTLADIIEKQGFKAQIINLGVEKYLDKNFSLSAYVKENNINFVAFSLHWYQQTYDVIESIRILKEKCPDVFVMLGGFTASYYAYEIMEQLTFIDAIVKGEGEKPLELLIKALKQDKTDFSKIPNLIWRADTVIIENIKNYNATSADLDSFTNFKPKLMKNYETYSKVPYVIEYHKENQFNNIPTSHGIPLGRGCLGNCAWCGGGYLVTKKFTGRNFISYRNPNNVVNEMKTLKSDYGIELFRFAFDPDSKNKEYLILLFEKIKKEFNKNVDIEFASHSLPDKKFLKVFKDAVSENSTVTIAPEFYNETLRKKYKSFFYTNKELEDVLNLMEELEIQSELYFSIVPNVDEKENVKSREYLELLKNKYKFIKNCYIFEIGIEPGSYWSIYPEKFNLKIKEKKFIDYYNDTKGISASFENSELFK